MNKYNLKELIKIHNGKDYKGLNDGPIPVYGSGGIMKYVDNFIYDGEVLLLPRKGTLDNIQYVNGKFWCVDTTYWATPITNQVNMQYLYCYLSLLDLSARDSGSTLPSMTFDSYYSLPIKLPNIDIQNAYANLIFDILEKIELNNKTINVIESLAKTIYDYWFLQFEFPNEDGKPYKSSGGKMVWNDELKREIPEGWKVEPLFQCMDVTYGYPLSTNFFNQEEGTPVIRIRDILDNSTSAYTTEKIPDKYISESKDLLVGMDGNFHMNYCCEDGQYINQRIVRIREKDNISTMQVCFEIAPYIKKKEQNAARSTVGHLSDKDLKSIYILNSNNIHIYKVFNGFLEKICTARKENKKLTALRDFLLPMLMNGQVTFKEEDE